MTNRILLTGGMGLLGRAIGADLKDRADITHFSRRDPDDGNAWIQGDIRHREARTQACAGMDAIVHSAALHAKSWKAAGDDAVLPHDETSTWEPRERYGITISPRRSVCGRPAA